MTDLPASAEPDATIVGALATAVSAVDLEGVTRPLLAALNEVTGLESTYLTAIDLDEDIQRIVYSLNTRDGFAIPEGLEVTWSDTLCRRAMESGRVYTDDVPDVWGDSEAARELAIQTYASAPVILPDGSTYGTLCGASADERPADERTLELLQVFSRIIADAIAREQQLIRAREEAAWAQEQMRARSRFLASAEHELKTPIAVISGWSRMLLERSVDEDETDRAIRSIEQQAETLAARIRRMLEHARAEIIVNELSLESLDLASLVGDVAQVMKVISSDHVIEVVTRVPVTALADRKALQIVVEHLIENAVKHTEGGRVTCVIDEAHGRSLLVVHDEGPGVPPDVDIFEAFTRGTSAVPGSGLGLSIVRSLVEAMNGEVTAADGPNGGAAITVSLPQPA